MKIHNLKNDSMNECDLQTVYNYRIYPRDNVITTNRLFVNIDDGRLEGTHWTCFHTKENRTIYFHSFGGQPDKFPLNELHKPRTYHNYKIQDTISKLCCSYCFYFFYLIGKTNYYDTIYFTKKIIL